MLDTCFCDMTGHLWNAFGQVLVSLRCSQPTHGPLREGILTTKAVKWAFVTLPDWGLKCGWRLLLSVTGNCAVWGLRVSWKEGFSFRLGWLLRFVPILITQSCRVQSSSPCAEERELHTFYTGRGEFTHRMEQMWILCSGFSFQCTFKLLGLFHLLSHPVAVTTLGFCCPAIQGEEEIWKAFPVSQRWRVHNILRANQIL